MRLVLFGAPGVGKGTYANLLSAKYGIPHVSTGEIIRDEVERQSPLGLAVAELMARGHLVSDDIAVALVKERFKRGDCAKGFVLDGFPRTVPQARAFDEFLSEHHWKVDFVANIRVNNSEIVDRISKRYTCRKCHAIYNTEYAPPRREGFCDNCGGPLYKRSDEDEHAVRTRLNVYMHETAPVLDYYKTQGVVLDMDGTGKGVEDNFSSLLKLIQSHHEGQKKLTNGNGNNSPL
ncbi:adenylate kinase [Candidatus Micrarchaeota archaeon]|nr:adenylate kinase [Candidatus Micrarchaeota archaeon]MBI5176559.1 adenylate kinase [Candidatus Micrarchaeota archaeon]